MTGLPEQRILVVLLCALLVAAGCSRWRKIDDNEVLTPYQGDTVRVELFGEEDPVEGCLGYVGEDVLCVSNTDDDRVVQRDSVKQLSVLKAENTEVNVIGIVIGGAFLAYLAFMAVICLTLGDIGK